MVARLCRAQERFEADLIVYSRELVAKVVLACAKESKTEGLSIEVMDGEGDIEGELKAVVDGKLDAWTG